MMKTHPLRNFSCRLHARRGLFQLHGLFLGALLIAACGGSTGHTNQNQNQAGDASVTDAAAPWDAEVTDDAAPWDAEADAALPPPLALLE
ncbi:MAG: hypothetical protein J7M25_13465, partial [Deltaproteobacteria bacterium]|nr:hypothetical protein [Deltaproteobacteria bacterium]